MNWEDFNKADLNNYIFTNKILTNINCPNCNKKVYMRTDIILTSNPAKYQYECECGWIGYSYNRSSELCITD